MGNRGLFAGQRGFHLGAKPRIVSGLFLGGPEFGDQGRIFAHAPCIHRFAGEEKFSPCYHKFAKECDCDVAQKITGAKFKIDGE